MQPAANTKLIYVPTATGGSRTLLALATLFLFVGGLGLVLLLQGFGGQSFDLRRGAFEAKTCNETCSRNAECQPNHFCYQNKCRLALNPSSEMCAKASPSPSPTARASVKPKTSPSSQLKGGPDATLSGDLEPSPSPATTGGVLFTPSPKPTPSLEPLPTSEEPIIENQGVLWTIRRALASLGGLLTFLVIGALVLGVILLILYLLSRMRRKGPPPTPTAKPATTNEQYEKELQAKLDALKQQSAPPAVVEPAPVTTVQSAPVMTVEPQPSATVAAAPEEAMTPPPSARTMPPVTPTPVMEQSFEESPATMPAAPYEELVAPQPGASDEAAGEEPSAPSLPVNETPTETPVFSRSSTMMERIRQKGINPPSGATPSDSNNPDRDAS